MYCAGSIQGACALFTFGLAALSAQTNYTVCGACAAFVATRASPPAAASNRSRVCDVARAASLIDYYKIDYYKIVIEDWNVNVPRCIQRESARAV